MENKGPLVGRIILISNVIIGVVAALILTGIFMAANFVLLWISWLVLAIGSLPLFLFPRLNKKTRSFLRNYGKWIFHEGTNFSDLG